MSFVYENDDETDPFSAYARQVHSVLFYLFRNLSEEVSLRNMPPTYTIIQNCSDEIYLHEGKESNLLKITPPEPIEEDLYREIGSWRHFLVTKMEESEGIGFCIWLYVYNSLDEEFIFTILYKKGFMIQGHLIPYPLDKDDNPRVIAIEDILPDFEMTFEDDILIN